MPKRTGASPDQSPAPPDGTAKEHRDGLAGPTAAGTEAEPTKDEKDGEATARRAMVGALNAVIKRAKQGDFTALPELRKALTEHPE